MHCSFLLFNTLVLYRIVHAAVITHRRRDLLEGMNVLGLENTFSAPQTHPNALSILALGSPTIHHKSVPLQTLEFPFTHAPASPLSVATTSNPVPSNHGPSTIETMSWLRTSLPASRKSKSSNTSMATTSTIHSPPPVPSSSLSSTLLSTHTWPTVTVVEVTTTDRATSDMLVTSSAAAEPSPSLSSSPIAGISSTWKIIGVGMIICTTFGLAILFGTFLDAIFRVFKDVFCGYGRSKTADDEFLQNEPPLWEKGMVPEGAGPHRSVFLQLSTSAPSVVALAHQRSAKGDRIRQRWDDGSPDEAAGWADSEGAVSHHRPTPFIATTPAGEPTM
jgi:hypothetical protein